MYLRGKCRYIEPKEAAIGNIMIAILALQHTFLAAQMQCMQSSKLLDVCMRKQLCRFMLPKRTTTFL